MRNNIYIYVPTPFAFKSWRININIVFKMNIIPTPSIWETMAFRFGVIRCLLCFLSLHTIQPRTFLIWFLLQRWWPLLEWSHSSRLEAFRSVVVEVGWCLVPLDTAIQGDNAFLPKSKLKPLISNGFLKGIAVETIDSKIRTRLTRRPKY